MSGSPDIRRFSDKNALIASATDFLSSRLSKALDDQGQASLMLSGGSSPKPVYQALSNQPLAWNGVAISLVDERWVPSGSPASNADFIRDCFHDSAAEQALFVPLYNGHETALDGIEAAEQALALMKKPFDICVMGMGLDGHTASWFPQSGGLSSALDPENASTLCAIDATGCEVAGQHPERITLTYSAVAASGDVILLLPSAEKLTVFEKSTGVSKLEAPVRTLLDLGEKLTVFALEGAA